MYRVEQKNKFSVGEQIEVMKPDGRNVTVTVRGLMDEKGEPMESCPHPQQIFYVDLGMEPDEYDILRRREEEAIALVKKNLKKHPLSEQLRKHRGCANIRQKDVVLK